MPLGLLAFIGLWISFSPLSLATKAASRLLILSASILWDCVMMRPYHAIIGSEVLVHPLIPWRPAVRVPLRDAAVVERGCDHDTDGDRNVVNFIVRYGPGPGETVNLGGGVGRTGAAEWLEVMRPYTSGAITLPPASTANVPHDIQCLDNIALNLDASQRAALVRLLS